MRKVTTHDGSETFVNETVNQSYHSFTGAVEEALKKFCEPCKIKQLALKAQSTGGNIRILDVCFGLGYNSAMAVQVAQKANPNCRIEIVGLENDPRILDKIKEVSPAIEDFDLFKQLDSKHLSVEQERIKITILLDDARVAIKSLAKESFDAVFFDPFSPSVVPEMWNAEFLTDVARVMSETAILATYSCARMLRDNLTKANLAYTDGPKVGRRGPGTVATKKWPNLL